MLVVARRLLQQGCCFATARIRPRKQQNTGQQGEPLEKDVFKAYRKTVEQDNKSSGSRSCQETGTSNTRNPSSRLTSYKICQMLIARKCSKKPLSLKTEPSANAIFDQNSGRSLLSDYGNYKPYDKVYPILQDRNLGEGEYLEDSIETQNLYKFLDKLPDDYQQKQEIEAVIHTFSADKQNMSLSEYGKQLQKEINDGQRHTMKRYQDFKIHHEQKYSIFQTPYDENEDINEDWFDTKSESLHDFTGSPNVTDPWNNQQGFEATLSPQTVDLIYELYLQGWTVRDISKRFGILPARTKFCVWVRAQLFHQVIPKLGVRYYLRAMREEQRYNQTRTFCDYGLDLDELSNAGILTEINEWNGEMLDAQRKEDEYRGAMVKLQKAKKFSKYEMVVVGTHGKENSKYRLKQWVIFRGKGSDQYFLKNKLLKELTKAHKKFNKVYY